MENSEWNCICCGGCCDCLYHFISQSNRQASYFTAILHDCASAEKPGSLSISAYECNPFCPCRLDDSLYSAISVETGKASIVCCRACADHQYRFGNAAILFLCRNDRDGRCDYKYLWSFCRSLAVSDCNSVSKMLFQEKGVVYEPFSNGTTFFGSDQSRNP